MLVKAYPVKIFKMGTTGYCVQFIIKKCDKIRQKSVPSDQLILFSKYWMMEVGNVCVVKSQIEKRYNVKCVREQNPYMSGRYFWSVKDMNGKEIERCETLSDVDDTLRIVRAM